MRDNMRRVAALSALVLGDPAIAGSPIQTRIQQELAEVSRARSVNAKHRRWVLQVLHSTRALDSTLKSFTTHHGCAAHPPSLGKYISVLVKHTSTTLGSQLSTADAARFKKSIANVRNHYMHEAGAFPASDREVLTLLSEMADCLSTILSL
jgi:hypothetical protein